MLHRTAFTKIAMVREEDLSQIDIPIFVGQPWVKSSKTWSYRATAVLYAE